MSGFLSGKQNAFYGSIFLSDGESLIKMALLIQNILKILEMDFVEVFKPWDVALM